MRVRGLIKVQCAWEDDVGFISATPGSPGWGWGTSRVPTWSFDWITGVVGRGTRSRARARRPRDFGRDSRAQFREKEGAIESERLSKTTEGIPWIAQGSSWCAPRHIYMLDGVIVVRIVSRFNL